MQAKQLFIIRVALVSGVGAFAALFLRTRVEIAPPARRGPVLVIGWALGEGVALFGIVQHFIGGPLSTMAIGLLTFVVVLLLLPIPRERASR